MAIRSITGDNDFCGSSNISEGIYGDFPVDTDDLEIIEEGSQTIIKVNSDKTGITKVYLEQLVKQDETGIWTVVGYDVDEKDNPV